MWFRTWSKPSTLTFTKVQSAQSPGLVAEGWEEERTNNLWHCNETGKLYNHQGDDFIFVQTKSLAEFIADLKTDHTS